MRKILCFLGIHSYENLGSIFVEENNSEFPYVIGHYEFECKHCRKKIHKQFAFPHTVGIRVTKEQAIIQAKKFKGLR